MTKAKTGNPKKILGVNDNYKVALCDIKELEFVKRYPEILENKHQLKAVLHMFGLDVTDVSKGGAGFQQELIKGGYKSPFSGIEYKECGLVWTGFEREDKLWQGTSFVEKYLHNDAQNDFKVAKELFKIAN